MTRPFFSKERIGHFDIFDHHATDALSQIKARLREGFPIDIQDLASRFTMDSATEFLFGQNVHSLGAGLPYPFYAPEAKSTAAIMAEEHPANKFSRAFEAAQALTALRAQRGMSWPLAEFWKDKVEEQMVTVNAYIDPILRAAVERKRAAEDEAGFVSGKNGKGKEQNIFDREVKDGESLLDHLINYTEGELPSTVA